MATVDGVQPKANWAPLSIGPQLFQTRAWNLPSDFHALANYTWWQDLPDGKTIQRREQGCTSASWIRAALAGQYFLQSPGFQSYDRSRWANWALSWKSGIKISNAWLYSTPTIVSNNSLLHTTIMCKKNWKLTILVVKVSYLLRNMKTWLNFCIWGRWWQWHSLLRNVVT